MVAIKQTSAAEKCSVKWLHHVSLHGWPLESTWAGWAHHVERLWSCYLPEKTRKKLENSNRRSGMFFMNGRTRHSESSSSDRTDKLGQTTASANQHQLTFRKNLNNFFRILSRRRRRSFLERVKTYEVKYGASGIISDPFVECLFASSCRVSSSLFSHSRRLASDTSWSLLALKTRWTNRIALNPFNNPSRLIYDISLLWIFADWKFMIVTWNGRDRLWASAVKETSTTHIKSSWGKANEFH